MTETTLPEVYELLQIELREAVEMQHKVTIVNGMEYYCKVRPEVILREPVS